MAEYGINGNTLNLQHVQLKAKPAAQWAEDEVLLAGEVGVELDTKKAKIGDGTTQWKALDYSANPQLNGLVSTLTTKMETAESTLSSYGSRIDALDGENGEIAGLKAKDTAHETRMTNIESKDSAQDDTLSSHAGRIAALEGITTLSANPFRE